MAGIIAKKVAASTRSGSLKAVRSYFNMSHDGNIWNRGIESYISAKVAEQIWKDHNYPIELELPYKHLLDDSQTRKRLSSIGNLTSNSRFDVTVFRKSRGQSYGVVEIKKRFAEFKISNDRQRITEILEFTRISGIRFGILLSIEPIRGNASKHLYDKLDEAIAVYTENFPSHNVEIEFKKLDGDFGTTKKGIPIVGAVAYSTIIEA